MALSLRTHLQKVQYNIIQDSHCIDCPCYTVFFFNTTLSALSHRPQVTSDTISHYSLTLLCLSFQLLPAAQAVQLLNIYKITRGSNLSFTTSLPFTQLPFALRSSARGCATRLNLPLLCPSFSSGNNFFFSL